MRTKPVLLLAVGAAFLLASGSSAASPLRGIPPAALGEDVGPAIDAILDEYQQAIDACMEAARAAKTDEERNKVYEDSYPKAETYAERLWKLVDRQPEDPGCAKALGWIFGNTGDARASELLLSKHVDSEEAGIACLSYGQQNAGARPTLEGVLARAKQPATRGMASFALGQHLIELAKWAEDAQAANDEKRGTLAAQFGEAAVIEWMDAEPAELRKQGEALLQRVADEFASVAHPYEGTLGAAAEAFLFELRRLQIGMVVPEIEGEDIGGVSFKLSDYRGKVVVLDFWGHW